MKKIKLYVGCALNNAPKKFVDDVFAFRKSLAQNPNIEILEFFGPGDPQAIYDRDINECVANADAMLAICDLPSLGLGFEMATHSKHFKKPLLAVAHADASVSRLILGIHGEGIFEFQRYKNLSDVSAMLDQWLARTFNIS